MPRIVREAEIDWEGTTARGSGVVRAVEHRVVRASVDDRCSDRGASEGRRARKSFSPRRTPRASSLLSVASSLALGTPPERMHVHCTITMDEVEGAGHRIVASDIAARAVVPGADEETFAGAARGRRCGLPVLRAHQSERYRHRRSRSRGRKLDGRSHSARHLVWITHGRRRDDHERRERRLRAARRDVGVARRGVGRAHEPGGAHRRRARGVLLDGALARPRGGRHTGGEARRRHDRDLRARHRESRRSSSLSSAPCPESTSRRSCTLRARRRTTARSRWRSRRCPRSRFEPRWRSRPIPSGDGDRAPRRRAGPLLRGSAGAHVRPCGLQRPPSGCRRRPPPEGAGDAEAAGGRVA